MYRSRAEFQGPGSYSLVRLVSGEKILLRRPVIALLSRYLQRHGTMHHSCEEREREREREENRIRSGCHRTASRRWSAQPRRTPPGHTNLSRQWSCGTSPAPMMTYTHSHTNFSIALGLGTPRSRRANTRGRKTRQALLTAWSATQGCKRRSWG